MANTLTRLFPDLYEALDIISHELTGFIPAVYLDAAAARAAVDQSVLVPITPASPSANIVPGQLPPDTGDQTIGFTEIKITKAKAVPFRWNGEEQRGLNTGVGYANIRAAQIAQAMRTLVNEVEADLGGLFVNASRAYGIAGTAPFGSSPALGDAAQALKILKDNGAPDSDLHLVIDTSAGVNLRSLTQLTKVNEAGGPTLLRQGILLDLFGMAIRESAGVQTHVKGTASGYLSDLLAGYVAGNTSIHLDTGTGTHLAGDVITFAGDTNKYVIGTGAAGDGDKDIVLNLPGLRGTLANDLAATTGASFTANMAFHRNAMVLVARQPALPEEGDSAIDRQAITDPRTGLTFEISMYGLYRRVYYEVALAWGVANIKPAHTAILMG